MGFWLSSARIETHDGRRLPMKKGERKETCLNGHPSSMRTKRGQCNGCRGIYNKKYYGKYRDQEHARYKVYSQTPKGRFKNIKNGAIQRNLQFGLTFYQFMQFWGKPCVYGCTIETIGLDRIDNTTGYFVENLRPMCSAHNQMKMDRTQDEFIEKCRQVASFHSI